MWMMTRYGMFSTVVKELDEVQVRARTREDLELLKQRFQPLLGKYKIIDTPAADYACRIFLPRSEFALLSFLLADDIDYGNFKAEVERLDPERAVLYHRVWALLLSLQNPHLASYYGNPAFFHPDPQLPGRRRKKKSRRNRKKKLTQSLKGAMLSPLKAAIKPPREKAGERS